jgi:hypothetical protein
MGAARGGGGGEEHVRGGWDVQMGELKIADNHVAWQ